MNNYRDNIEIDLRDLLAYILKHYKRLIALVALGCILGCLFGAIKNNMMTTPKEESARSLLTAKEIYEVNSAVENYRSYFNRYNEILDYKNNSLLMKIDGYNTPTSTCSYLISGYDKNNTIPLESNSITNINNSIEKNIADNIITLYSTELKKNDSIASIKETIGKDIDDKYISELYSISKNGYSIMTITAYGRSKEESDSVLKELMQMIAQKEDLIKKNIPHDIVEVSSYTSKEKSGYIISNQDNANNQLKDLNNSMIAVTANLSANQKNYFKEQLEASDIKYGIEKDEEIKRGIKPIIKYGLLGCIFAAFATFFFYSLIYVLSPTIKVEDDMKYAFQIPVIGSINQTDLDKELIISGINAVADTHSAKKICLVSTYPDDTVEAYKSVISQRLKDKGIQSTICRSIINDSESLNNAISSDGIILMETIQKSKYEDISKVAEICKNYNIQMLGSILNYK